MISVPAYFNDGQRYATIKAAELAGLIVERTINEPTAAAIAYGLHKLDKDFTFMVLDLGGGTFDVCIMELFEGALQVKSTSGVSQLGGEDFTVKLIDNAVKEFDLNSDDLRVKDPNSFGLLYKRCELMKRELSSNQAANLLIPPIKNVNKESIQKKITREEVEEIFKPLIDQLFAPCREALRGAHKTPDQLEEIIMVGGATRMPCFKGFVENTFQMVPLAGIHPDLAIVQGAAIQASLSVDRSPVTDFVVTDVLSHSLGVDVSKEFGDEVVDGFFGPVIHRNTVIPTSRSKVFSTIFDYQTSINFTIYEGESRRVKKNRKLGELKVKGIPKLKKDDATVKVTFTYDLSGILGVEAIIQNTGKKFSKVLSRTTKILKESELEKAQIKINAIKMYGKQKHIKDLLVRSELLLRDLVGKDRQSLELEMDSLENAVALNTPKLIESCYESLLKMCHYYDKGERW